jgi:hypothetical protein
VVSQETNALPITIMELTNELSIDLMLLHTHFDKIMRTNCYLVKSQHPVVRAVSYT